MTQTLITRAQWGATEQDGTGSRPLPIREWWLHHSGGVTPADSLTNEISTVRGLERIGEERFGAGISYTFPVAPSGRIYEGHSFGRVGTHTRGHNTIGAAFCVMGNYMTKRMTAASHEAIARRMVIERRRGRALTHRLNGGHTQASSPDGGTLNTDCPGDLGLLSVPIINARADELWAAGYDGSSEPDELGEGDLSEITVRNPRTGEQWPLPNALWSMWTYILDGRDAAAAAARDAAKALAIAEATAKAVDLDQSEIDAIGQRVGAEFDERFDVVVTPAEPPAEGIAAGENPA